MRTNASASEHGRPVAVTLLAASSLFGVNGMVWQLSVPAARTVVVAPALVEVVVAPRTVDVVDAPAAAAVVVVAWVGTPPPTMPQAMRSPASPVAVVMV